jgi:SAM-dependent methyltransferase
VSATVAESVPATPDELAGRLFMAGINAMELFCVYVGDQLGFYRTLRDRGALSAPELANDAGTNERLTREWLEQQATAGFLACDNPDAPAAERRFRLPEGYEAVLVDPESPAQMASFAQIVAGTVAPLQHLLAVFRGDGGVPYADYGRDLHQGQARVNRPAFANLLAQEWIAAMPDVVARLRADPPARIADIGMGQGWSSIALAKAFPTARVDGIDPDEASVAAAQENVRAAGLGDRVTMIARDAGDPELAGQYDFALAIECVHDMSDPVAVLSAMRRLVGPGGTVLIVDERVPDAFAPNGDEVERMMYGFSVLHCLPVGMADTPSAETGAVMRRPTFRRYAAAAGFSAVEELDVPHDTFRFYRLTG